jgi:hypothetical protein
MENESVFYSHRIERVLPAPNIPLVPPHRKSDFHSHVWGPFQ